MRCNFLMLVLGTYSNYTEAHQAMLDAINVALDGEADEYEADGDAEINKFNGWANEAGKNDSNYDWNILRLFNDGRTIRSETDMYEAQKADR